MTTKVKVEVVHGNKDVEVVDQNGHVHATLEGEGRSVEVTLHDSLQLSVREVGQFHNVGNVSLGGEPGSNVPDERVEDAGGAPKASL